MFSKAAILDLTREADRAALKREELNKLSIAGAWSVGRRGYEITDFGIERGMLCARVKATVDGQRYSLGKRSVTIENIRIPSPRVVILSGDPEKPTRTFNPVQAYRDVIAQTVNLLLGKPINVEREIIGRTTTVLYSEAGSGGNAVDGYVRRNMNESFSALRTGNGTAANTVDDDNSNCRVIAASTQPLYSFLDRLIWTFDGSVINGADVVSSATFSANTRVKYTGLGAFDFHILSASPASYTSLIAADYQNAFGSTSFASIDSGSLSTLVYTDYALNAAGIASLNIGGAIGLGMKLGWDLNDTSPTWASTQISGGTHYMTDYVGTTNDPKLTIEHAPAASGNIVLNILLRGRG